MLSHVRRDSFGENLRMVLAVRPTKVQWQKMLILSDFPICSQAVEFCRENLNSFGSRLAVVVHP